MFVLGGAFLIWITLELGGRDRMGAPGALEKIGSRKQRGGFMERKVWKKARKGGVASRGTAKGVSGTSRFFRS